MFRRDQGNLLDTETRVERGEGDGDVDAVVVGEGLEIELLEERPVDEHVAGERLTHPRVTRREHQRAREVVGGVALAAGPGPQRQDQRRTLLFGGFEHVHQIARVVPAEVGVDEEQEVDAVAQRLLHEQLHVGALADARAGRLQHPLRDAARPRREPGEGVVVARLVREREPGVVRRAEHARAGFDAIGQLHDSFRFVPGWDTDQKASQGFLRGGRTPPLAAERLRLSGGR